MHTMKRGLLPLLVCLCLVLGALTASASSTSSPAQSAPQLQEVTLSLGSIAKNVIATGTLRFDQEEAVLLPDDLTIKGIAVKAGEVVHKGQLLASYDVKVLEDERQAASDALEAQDEAILQLLGQQKSSQQVKPAMAGVVKVINLEAGTMVQQSLGDRPAAILSVNGLMQVRIKPTEALSLGQSLRVKLGTQQQTGSVARLEADGTALISFPDTRALPGDTVEVLLPNNTKLGEGIAKIALPYALYTKLDGVVSTVQARLNAAVTRNTTLFTLSDADPAPDYQEALAERERLVQELRRVEQLLAEPQLHSDMDGIVSAVSAQAGQAMKEGSELLRLYPKQAFVLDVAVDELDILSVQPGQEGFAALDALKGTPLQVKVARISPLGTTSGGITSYTVTLAVQEDERLLSGMNGTATLTVGEAKDAVLVPLGALMSDRGGSYVLLKGAADDAQGVKTYVQTSISDAHFAAVTDGLKGGDVVLMRPSAVTNSTQRQQGFGQMMNPGRNFMPGGGQRP